MHPTRRSLACSVAAAAVVAALPRRVCAHGGIHGYPRIPDDPAALEASLRGMGFAIRAVTHPGLSQYCFTGPDAFAFPAEACQADYVVRGTGHRLLFIRHEGRREFGFADLEAHVRRFGDYWVLRLLRAQSLPRIARMDPVEPEQIMANTQSSRFTGV